MTRANRKGTCSNFSEPKSEAQDVLASARFSSGSLRPIRPQASSVQDSNQAVALTTQAG